MEVEDSEDLDLISIQLSDITRRNGVEVQTAGISASGLVYLRGDIHPMGSYPAMARAAAQQVPYVAVSAVEVLFPAEWLRAECLHDLDRLRVIGEAEALVRRVR